MTDIVANVSFALGGALATFLFVGAVFALRPRSAVAVAVGLIMAILVFVPPSELSHLPFGAIYPPAVSMLLLGLAVMKRWETLRAPKLLLPVAAVAGLPLFSTFVSGTAEPDPYYLLTGVVGFLTFLLVGNAYEKEKVTLKRTFVLLGLVQVLLVFFEVGTGQPLVGNKITLSVVNPFIPSLDRAQGTLGHPLALSCVLLVALALSLGMKMRLVLRLASAAALILGIVLTGSSTSLLIGMAIVVWAIVARRRFVARVFGVLFLVLVALSFPVWGEVPQGLQDDLTGNNISHRSLTLASVPGLLSLQGVYQTLFGNGIGSATELYETGVLIDDGFRVIDNQLVTTLVQAGIIGLVALLVIMFRAFKRGSRETKALVIIFGMLAMSFDFLAWYPMLVAFYACLGLIVGPAGRPANPTRTPLVTPRPERVS